MKAKIDEAVSYLTQDRLDYGVSIQMADKLYDFLDHVASVVVIAKLVEILAELLCNLKLGVGLRQVEACLHNSAPISMNRQLRSKISQSVVKLLLEIEHPVSIDVG